MTALEMFPERNFMESHTQEDTSSLGACGRTGVGNQTLEQGTVQEVLFRFPGRTHSWMNQSTDS